MDVLQAVSIAVILAALSSPPAPAEESASQGNQDNPDAQQSSARKTKTKRSFFVGGGFYVGKKNNPMAPIDTRPCVSAAEESLRKEVPALASGTKGVVRVKVDHTGKLLDAKMHKSSNDKALDEAVLAAIGKTVFPPFPPNFFDDNVSFDIKLARVNQGGK